MESPGADETKRMLGGVSWVVTGACAVLVGSMLWVLYWAADAFRGLYRGLNRPFPAVTIFILRVPPWAYVLAGAVLAAALAWKELLLRSKTVAIWTSVAVVVLGAIVWSIALYWLSFPLVQFFCELE